MRRFQFRLQHVLQQRERAESAALEQMHLALARQEAAKRSAATAESALTEAILSRPGGRRGERLDAAAIGARERYVAALRFAADTARQALIQANREADAALERLVEARRQKQLIERIRARKLSAHMKEEARLEQIELDEIAGRMSERLQQHATERGL